MYPNTCPTLKTLQRQARELKTTASNPDTLDGFGEDLEANQATDILDSNQGTTQIQPNPTLETPPSTLAEAGERLNPAISSTSVKARILAIAENLNIPRHHLATWNGDRATGLTSLGWTLLKDLPHSKHDRPAWYDQADTLYRHLIPVEPAQVEVVEAEVEDEISSDDLYKIVLRRQEALASPVQEATIPVNLLGGLSDIRLLTPLLQSAGEQLGAQVGQSMLAGFNKGLQQSQAQIRAALLESLGGGTGGL